MGTGFSKKKKDAKLMQQQFSQLKMEMSQTQAEGISGNGLVTVTIDGEASLTKIKIKPDCVDPEDVEGLEVLILAAYADAKKKLKEKLPDIPNLF